MSNSKTGILAVASHFESGGQRAESLISDAVTALEKKGVDFFIFS